MSSNVRRSRPCTQNLLDIGVGPHKLGVRCFRGLQRIHYDLCNVDILTLDLTRTDDLTDALT